MVEALRPSSFLRTWFHDLLWILVHIVSDLAHQVPSQVWLRREFRRCKRGKKGEWSCEIAWILPQCVHYFVLEWVHSQSIGNNVLWYRCREVLAVAATIQYGYCFLIEVDHGCFEWRDTHLGETNCLALPFFESVLPQACSKECARLADKVFMKIECSNGILVSNMYCNYLTLDKAVDSQQVVAI